MLKKRNSKNIPYNFFQKFFAFPTRTLPTFFFLGIYCYLPHLLSWSIVSIKYCEYLIVKHVTHAWHYDHANSGYRPFWWALVINSCSISTAAEYCTGKNDNGLSHAFFLLYDDSSVCSLLVCYKRSHKQEASFLESKSALEGFAPSVHAAANVIR